MKRKIDEDAAKITSKFWLESITGSQLRRYIDWKEKIVDIAAKATSVTIFEGMVPSSMMFN